MYLASTILQFALINTFGLPNVSSGPFSILFALFVLFHATVPKVDPRYMRIFGIDVSDKTLVYIAGLQLALR